jgi:hypothetical protein
MFLLLPHLAPLAGVSAVTQPRSMRNCDPTWRPGPWAAFASYAVGNLTMLIVILVQRAPRPFLYDGGRGPMVGVGGCLGGLHCAVDPTAAGVRREHGHGVRRRRTDQNRSWTQLTAITRSLLFR